MPRFGQPPRSYESTPGGRCVSVCVEHPLNLLRVARLRESQHEQDARLLRIERVRYHEVLLVVVRLAIARDDAVAHPARAHDDDAFLARLDQRRLDGRSRQAAVADAGVDEGFRPGGLGTQIASRFRKIGLRNGEEIQEIRDIQLQIPDFSE